MFDMLDDGRHSITQTTSIWATYPLPPVPKAEPAAWSTTALTQKNDQKRTQGTIQTKNQ